MQHEEQKSISLSNSPHSYEEELTETGAINQGEIPPINLEAIAQPHQQSGSSNASVEELAQLIEPVQQQAPPQNQLEQMQDVENVQQIQEPLLFNQGHLERAQNRLFQHIQNLQLPLPEPLQNIQAPAGIDQTNINQVLATLTTNTHRVELLNFVSLDINITDHSNDFHERYQTLTNGIQQALLEFQVAEEDQMPAQNM